jgi:regulator of nucleoside diphosphate kinase
MLLQRTLAEIEQRGDRGDALRRKLSLAVVMMPQDVPDDVVTLNSRVRFRIGGGLEFERVLVAAGDREVVGSTLPLDSPRGLGLLGMRVGQSATVTLQDEAEDTIDVLSILHQPEARRAASAAGRAAVTIGRGRRAAIHSPPRSPGDNPGPAAA